MQSMSAEMQMKAVTNGGFFSAWGKKWFGGESFFVNRFTNRGSAPMRVTLSQDVPGDIIEMKMEAGRDLCLQEGGLPGPIPGMFHSSPPGRDLSPGFSGEGLVKLKATGEGTLWFGAYGGIVEKKG